MEDLAWRVLRAVAKRGYVGASREDLFQEIRGVAYEDLEGALRTLEEEGYVTMEWTGPNTFVAAVTEKGSVYARDEYERRIEGYRKQVEEEKDRGGLERI
jgi:DNA-binding PadR family transcriptional regulator